MENIVRNLRQKARRGRWAPRVLAWALLMSMMLMGVGAVSATAAGAAHYSTQAYGMGGAMTGWVADASALVYNPAGLSKTNFDALLSLSSNHLGEALAVQQYVGDPFKLNERPIQLDLTAFSGVSFSKYGVGVAFTGDIATDTAGCEAGARFCAKGDMMGRIIVGAAFEPDFIAIPGIHFGLTYNHYAMRNVAYSVTETAVPGYTTTTVEKNGQGGGVGVGVMFNTLPFLDFGIAVDNVISGIAWESQRTVAEFDAADNKIGSDMVTSLPTESTRMDTVVRGGAALDLPVIALKIAADIASDGTFGIGVEKRALLNAVSVRAGYRGSEGVGTTSLGVGVHLGPARVDIGTATEDFKNFGFSISGAVRF